MATNESFKQRRERNLANRDDVRGERGQLHEARQQKIQQDNERRDRIRAARLDADPGAQKKAEDRERKSQELEADRARRRAEFEARNSAAAAEQERDPLERYENLNEPLPPLDGEMETKEREAPATKERKPRRPSKGGVNIRDERQKPEAGGVFGGGSDDTPTPDDR